MLVGLSAVFIGVCALFVSLYEAHLMREEQRSAVIPLLELGRSHYVDMSGENTGKYRLSLHVENVGIGPAIIRNFEVTVDNEPHQTWRSAMQALLGRPATVNYGQSTIMGRTVPPDRMITMFDLSTTELTREILDEFDRLDFEACFCSVFDECWTTSYRTFGQSQAVEVCEISENPFLQ